LTDEIVSCDRSRNAAANSTLTSLNVEFAKLMGVPFVEVTFMMKAASAGKHTRFSIIAAGQDLARDPSL
jgi:hypothetical protein